MNPTDIVLVCLLKDKRDLEIARVLGWYRIPVKTAPKLVAVDWLAFYQTAKFGADKWAINYIAPVKGHELATRAELLRTQPDHPRAQEMYYKLQLGPLERLPRSIPSRKWRRLTFLYTTGERLLVAEELNDLIIQSAERERLWKALRERGLAVERQYEVGRQGEIDLAVLCVLGQLGITVADATSEPPLRLKERSGWEYLSFPEAQVKTELADVVQTIEEAVQRLGGLA